MFVTNLNVQSRVSMCDVNAEKDSSMKTSAASKGTDLTVDEQDTMALVGT